MTKTVTDMTDKLLLKSWQTIASLGQQMHDLASNEDWSSIAAIAVSRHQLVVKHFNEFPVNPERAEFYRRHLSAFLMQEEQLKELIQKARKKAIKGVVSINQGKRAVSAYTSSSKSL